MIALDPDLAAGGLDQTGDGLEQCRLAAPVGAKQAEDLSAFQVKVQAAEGPFAVVFLAQIVDFE